MSNIIFGAIFTTLTIKLGIILQHKKQQQLLTLTLILLSVIQWRTKSLMSSQDWSELKMMRKVRRVVMVEIMERTEITCTVTFSDMEKCWIFLTELITDLTFFILIVKVSGTNLYLQSFYNFKSL